LVVIERLPGWVKRRAVEALDSFLADNAETPEYGLSWSTPGACITIVELPSTMNRTHVRSCCCSCIGHFAIRRSCGGNKRYYFATERRRSVAMSNRLRT
jgi:hypothetical protein